MAEAADGTQRISDHQQRFAIEIAGELTRILRADASATMRKDVERFGSPGDRSGSLVTAR